MSSLERSRYEAGLHAANRALWRAHEAAEVLGDRGAMEDLEQMQAETRRLMELSIRGKRAPIRAQLELEL